MYQGIEDINKNLPPPNVPTHCLYGVGVDTPKILHYAESFPEGADEDPEVTMGDGDGTLNIESAEICVRWNNNNGGHSFSRKVFIGTDHLQMIQAEAVLKEIGEIVGAPTNPTPVHDDHEESWWDKVKNFFG